MSWFEALTLPDLLPLLVALAAVAAYELFLRRQARRNPGCTVQTMSAQARRAWMFALAERSDPEILAVQTLRNSTMAATFLASTAVLLIMGALTFSVQYGHSAAVGLFAEGARGVLRLKVLLLVGNFFVAFFSFTSAIRYYNHLIYVVGALNKQVPSTVEHAAALLNRAGRFYSYGMRSYYYSVPLVLWLFGDVWLLLGTAGVLCALYRLDRLPARDVPDNLNA